MNDETTAETTETTETTRATTSGTPPSASTRTPAPPPLAPEPASAAGPVTVTRPAGRAPVIVFSGLLAVLLTVVAGYQILEGTSGRVHRTEHLTYHRTFDLVRLTTRSGDVTVLAGPPGEVTVDARLTGALRRPRLETQVAGGRLTVSPDCPPLLTGACAGSLVVRVPPGTETVADTSSGDVEASGISAPLRLTTSSGDVRVRDTSGPLSVHISSGDLDATGIRGGTFRASTASGTVTATFAAAPERVTVSSSSGDVAVLLPRGGEAYRVSTHTSSGSEHVGVRTDPTAQRRVDARTSSGDVDVQYAP